MALFLLSSSGWASIQSNRLLYRRSGLVGSEGLAGQSPVPGISSTTVATPTWGQLGAVPVEAGEDDDGGHGCFRGGCVRDQVVDGDHAALVAGAVGVRDLDFVDRVLAHPQALDTGCFPQPPCFALDLAARRGKPTDPVHRAGTKVILARLLFLARGFGLFRYALEVFGLGEVDLSVFVPVVRFLEVTLDELVDYGLEVCRRAEHEGVHAHGGGGFPFCLPELGEGFVVCCWFRQVVLDEEFAAWCCHDGLTIDISCLEGMYLLLWL
jgi:hypothetical protein